MKLMKIIGKAVALPIRVIDLPFKIVRKTAEDDERGMLETIASSVEESIGELFEEE